MTKEHGILYILLLRVQTNGVVQTVTTKHMRCQWGAQKSKVSGPQRKSIWP